MDSGRVSPLQKRKRYLEDDKGDSTDDPSPTRKDRKFLDGSPLRKVARTADFGLENEVPAVSSDPPKGRAFNVKFPVVNTSLNPADPLTPSVEKAEDLTTEADFDTEDENEDPKEDETENMKHLEMDGDTDSDTQSDNGTEDENDHSEEETDEKPEIKNEPEDLSNMTLREIVTLCRKRSKKRNELEELRENEQQDSIVDAKLEGTESSKLEVKEHKGPKVVLKDGVLVVDEESLIKRASAVEQKEIIRDENFVLNQNSFRKRQTKRFMWNKDNTKLFYRALRIFGPNLTHMGLLFPRVDRRKIRDKLRKEEKVNPHLIDFAIKNRLTISTEELSNLLKGEGKQCQSDTVCISDGEYSENTPTSSPEGTPLRVEDLMEDGEEIKDQ